MANTSALSPRLESDLSLQHLQLALARVDVLLHRQIVSREQRNPLQDEGKSAWSGYFMTAAEAHALLQQGMRQDLTGLDGETEQAYAQALAEIEAQSHALDKLAGDLGQCLRLSRLTALMRLDPSELDILIIALAPVLDLRYARLYAYLQDDLTRLRPTLNLVLDLLAPPGPERLLWLDRFLDDAPLWRLQIVQRTVEPGPIAPLLLQHALVADETIVSWLLNGQYRPPAAAKYLSYQPEPNPDLALLPADRQQAILAAAQSGEIVVFHGQDELAHEIAVAYFAGSLRRSALTLDLSAVVSTELAAALDRCLRDALLTDAVVHIGGWDSDLIAEKDLMLLWALLDTHPGPIVITGRGQWVLPDVRRQRRLRWLAFPLPDHRQRAHLIHHFLADQGVHANLDLDALVGQFTLSTSQVRSMVHTALDAATQEAQTVNEGHLMAAARHHSNPRLSRLARKITPRHGWDDLILPADQIQMLREMVNTVRRRPQVLDGWAVGQKLAASAGVTALFAGPPGTGKTMAAEVMAASLGLDLYKIDLSSLVSKYIGETEKNLEQIFGEAESSNAILFFDEADAIFGKRSEVKDAHDRYANIEVSYLLQRMESYNGVTILATNLRANLDDAFLRRLQFVVDFPFPETEERLRIWQSLFPATVPREPELDFAPLAERFKLAGGNIRNAIVGAAYLAAADGQRVNMDHLLHATRRELQKLGRMIDHQ